MVDAEEVFLQPAEFLAQAFAGDVPAPDRLWITADIKPAIRNILGRDLGRLRQRYWRRGTRSAWILEELGKDQPITTGIVVENGKVFQVRVLVYRESRGWEVRYPAFTEQFRGAGLLADDRLDRPIDGITGATLSVRALTRIARVALFLDSRIDSKTSASSGAAGLQDAQP
jgi:hypothetical protein